MRVRTWDGHDTAREPTAAALGVFDGVHRGHIKLLRDAVADARERGILAAALTFSRDPDQVLSPAHAAPQLLTLEDKLTFLGQTGLDEVLVVPFTEGLASLDPRDFLARVLEPALAPTAIHVGVDFRFGAHATGSVDTLEAWGSERDISIAPHPLLEIDGLPVTSTRIRSLVAEGDVRRAADLLGRPTRVTGTVRKGRGEGAALLGVPTANVAPIPFSALPADGVYAGIANLEDGGRWTTAISVGTPPTFPEARDYVEAHLVGFDGDLVGSNLTLEFVERLRGQRRFDSPEALSQAMRADIRSAVHLIDDVLGNGQIRDMEGTA